MVEAWSELLNANKASPETDDLDIYNPVKQTNNPSGKLKPKGLVPKINRSMQINMIIKEFHLGIPHKHALMHGHPYASI